MNAGEVVTSGKSSATHHAEHVGEPGAILVSGELLVVYPNAATAPIARPLP